MELSNRWQVDFTLELELIAFLHAREQLSLPCHSSLTQLTLVSPSHCNTLRELLSVNFVCYPYLSQLQTLESSRLSPQVRQP